MFYGTSNTNGALQKIADDYYNLQKECTFTSITQNPINVINCIPSSTQSQQDIQQVVQQIIAIEQTCIATMPSNINNCIHVELTNYVNSLVSELKPILIGGNPIPIRVTAMSLPWGGLSDIGRNWEPPHYTHNAGTTIDMGFNKKILIGSDPHLLLLRMVILNDGGQLPVSYEGGNLSIPTDHFHVRFAS